MRMMWGRLAATLLALVLISAPAAAQSKVTIAVGGGACLCYRYAASVLSLMECASAISQTSRG